MRRLLTGALVAGLLAGCGGTGARPPRRAVSLDGCVRSGGEASVVRFPVRESGSSERLRAAVLGSGDTGLVLANESDLDLCAWLPFARKLSAAGLRVLVFDYGSLAPDGEVAAAAGELERAGAKAIVLAGASEGAKASILAAAADPRLARGLVLLSPEASLQGEEVAPAARKLSAPSLFVVSRGDPYSAEDTPALERVAGSSPKRLVVVPGSDHGVSLLRGAQAARVEAAIDGFLRPLARGG